MPLQSFNNGPHPCAPSLSSGPCPDPCILWSHDSHLDVSPLTPQYVYSVADLSTLTSFPSLISVKFHPSPCQQIYGSFIGTFPSLVYLKGSHPKSTTAVMFNRPCYILHTSLLLCSTYSLSTTNWMPSHQHNCCYV